MRTPRGIVRASDFTDSPGVANQWLNSVNTGLGAYVGGPAVVAYQSAVQSIPAGSTGTVIIFNAVEFDLDPRHSYNPANGRFQPLVAGYYLLSATVGLFTIDTIYIYKNGFSYRQYTPTVSSNNSLASTISQPVFLNGSTDYIEIWASHSSAGAVNTDPPYTYSGQPLGAKTFFSANLIRPA